MMIVDDPNQIGLDYSIKGDPRERKVSKERRNKGDSFKNSNIFRFDRRGGISKNNTPSNKKNYNMHISNGNVDETQNVRRTTPKNPYPLKSSDETNNNNKNTSENYWYDGVISSFFGVNACEDRNDMKTDIGEIICVSLTNNRTVVMNPILGQPSDVQILSDYNEEREDIDDNDSASEGTVSTLGKDLGDDLKSLPSVNCGFIPGDDETNLDELEDNLPMSPKLETRKSSFGVIRPKSISKNNNNNESVESLVENKLKNLKSEKSTREISNSIPYLRQKVFPMTAGRDDSQYSNDQDRDPDSVLETRRKFIVRELRNAVAKFGRYDVRCANITAALGDLYDENHEYKQSLRLHKDVVSVYSINLGDDNKKTLEAKLRLAQVQENSGDIDSATNTFFNVMNMIKALKGAKDLEAIDILVRIASCLRKKEKYELSIKVLKRALKAYRQVLGDTHPTVSITVDSIASLYITIGDYVKASAILEEVVKLKAATMGLTSKEVAASLSELATSYECAEQYSKAMKNLKKAYKIYADLVGESGEKSILMLERIALIYQATGQYKKAAIAYLGVLRGRKRALGDSHPTVADTYYHLGVSLRESNQEDKAFKCMKQALNIYVGEGKDIHDVEMIAEVMHELAIIHKSNHNMGDAVKTFRQEIAVRRKLGQPEYPSIAQALNHLGVTEFEIKNHNRALNYFMEALTIYEKRGTSPGTDFAEVLYNTGLVFESLRNKQRARNAFLEAARIFKENGYIESHPHYAKAVGKLKRLGYSCQCKNKNNIRCNSVPCESNSKTRSTSNKGETVGFHV
jgi:tetratricopeptide (TPR) repeat protein